MSVCLRMIVGVPRIIDTKTGRIAKSINGKPLDGGRSNAKTRGTAMAARQVLHINAALGKKRNG